MLDADASALARVATSHEVLARLHSVVSLFDAAPRVSRATGRDLTELDEGDVSSAIALRGALEAGPAAEVLRAAAELELPSIEALGPICAAPDLRARVDEVTSAAPSLRGRELVLARPLGLRGRVLEGRIFVGAPPSGGATSKHVAWQAAHEATVAEVTSQTMARGAKAAYEDIERTALGLLRSRARAAGLGAGHEEWLAHLDLSALGPIPDVPDGT